MAHSLPNVVKPTRYDVTLYNFDFERFTFSGQVIIRSSSIYIYWYHSLEELESLENKIVLNSHELKIHEAAIKSTGTKTESTISAKNISYDENARTATLDFGQTICHDERRSFLTLKFDGILNNAMAGFYRSAYTDKNGAPKFMFSTQCEVQSWLNC